VAWGFLPQRLTQKKRATFAARQFPALEINGTFYGLQKPDSFARWAEATPDEFAFTVKGSNTDKFHAPDDADADADVRAELEP
jgi:uncharacterized protein YecE (DUF72 family)